MVTRTAWLCQWLWSRSVSAAFVRKQLWYSSIYCYSSSESGDFSRNIQSTTIV